jgi:hypothetical protein
MPQNGEGVRGPIVAPQGGTVTIEVGPNENTIEVHAGGQGDTKSYRVEPDKSASIPIPAVPPGTILALYVGTGPNRRRLYIEVVALAS